MVCRDPSCHLSARQEVTTGRVAGTRQAWTRPLLGLSGLGSGARGMVKDAEHGLLPLPGECTGRVTLEAPAVTRRRRPVSNGCAVRRIPFYWRLLYAGLSACLIAYRL